MHTLPRPIKPELIDVGDTVEAIYPEDGGLTLRKRGTVSKIDTYVGSRLFLTAEGACIFRYSPGTTSPVKVILIARGPVPSEPLSMFDELLNTRL